MDIARTDWPHFFPDFYLHLLDLIRTRDTMALGLNMLLIASEELATPREDLATHRREELSRLLGGQVPQVRRITFAHIIDPKPVLVRTICILEVSFAPKVVGAIHTELKASNNFLSGWLDKKLVIIVDWDEIGCTIKD